MKRVFDRCVVVVFAVLLVGGLVGCGERELVGGLNDEQSIKALVVLGRAGISAEREGVKRGRSSAFRIFVDAGDYNKALEVLHEYGVPRASGLTAEELTRQSGFIPNSQPVSDMRLDLALSAQIERLVKTFPGVVDVKTVVRSNLSAESGDGREAPPSASVVVRYATVAGKQPFSVEDIRRLVLNAVPGLRSDQLLISTARVLLPTSGTALGVGADSGSGVVTLSRLMPFSFQVPDGQRTKALQQMALLLLLIAVAAGIVGYFAGWKTVSSKRPKRRAGPGLELGPNFFLDEAGKGGPPPPAKPQSPPQPGRQA